jgi:60 kDa SS-A/Ro ribonucleoprotein
VKSSQHPALAPVLDYIVGKNWVETSEGPAVPKILRGVEAVKGADSKKIPSLIREYGLSWEMVPSEALNDAATWEALLDGNLPLGALLRNLPKLTRVGVLKPLGARNAEIAARLTDQEALVKARIHPLNILIALKTYSGGRSLRGTESWTPVQSIVDALDKAFYLSFQAVEPAGKRTLIGLDVSGSMGWGQVAGLPLMPSEAVAALSLVTANVEPETHIVGFASTVRDLGISPRMRLDDVLRKTAGMTFGSTDASAAIRYALDAGLKVDTFIVMTDNETYAGRSHPHEVLEQYRRKTGIPAKLIVIATTATKFSIADPNDSGMLDIAGFDTAVPRLITEFSRGF